MQQHDSLRKWYLWAGYAGLGLPSIMSAAFVAAGASPIFLGVAVVGFSPLLLPALKLRALARKASTDAKVALASSCVIGASAAWTLLSLLAAASSFPDHDVYKRIGLGIATLACMMLAGIAISVLRAPEGQEAGQQSPRA